MPLSSGPRRPLPRVGVSACLLGQRVRWDGRHKGVEWLRDVLPKYAEIVPVCPEVEIGLGVPRPPIRLEDRGGRGIRLVRPSDREDLTARMETFAGRCLREAEAAGLDGWILKARSPSCGLRGVEVHGRRGSRPRRDGRGVFAGALLRRLGGIPVIEEGDLGTKESRRSFLLRIRRHRRLRLALTTK